MITIIADEGNGKIGAELSRELSLKGTRVEYISLEGVLVKLCVSCCKCTDRGDGRCVTRDDADWILPKVLGADVLLLVTPITFGSYSSKIKRVMDKFPLIMDRHYFMKNGELVKGGMQGRRFQFYVIGIRENGMDAEIEAFKKLHHENLIITRGVGKAYIVDSVLPLEMQNNILREVLST